MNATFVYSHSTHQFNGSRTTGTLGDLRSGRAHFAFNAETYVREFHDSVVETSSSFERHDICVLVPNGAPEPTLYNLMHTLTPFTWAICVTSITIMVFAYRLVQSLQIRLLANANTERHNYTTANALSIHFQSFFGDSISSLPTSTALRTLIVCWCTFSFLITTAFTAKLISSLVLPRHVPDINTLNELSDSPLNVIYPDFLNRTLWQFIADDHSLFGALRDQMRPVTIDRYHALVVDERTRNAYVMRSYAAKYIKKKFFDPITLRAVYHVMAECLVYSPMVYPIEQGSAYKGRINELLARLHEMGFIVKWERDTVHRNTIDGKIAMSDGAADEGDGDAVVGGGADGEEPKVVISVAHLQSAFYLWALGLVLSGMALAGEFWWMERDRRKSLYRVVYFDKHLARRHGCNVD